MIGGGDTGSDCIGTSWRQGARQVAQLEILPEPPLTRAESTPWPEWPLMRRDSSSHKEGETQRYWSVDTKAFTGEEGRVKQIHCVRVEWAPDESHGRLCPREIPGSDFALDADLVLIAMGFVGPGGTALAEQLGVEKDARGFIGRDDKHMTSVEGVFVTGDMQRGPSLVVHAISDGMQTAKQVTTYLNAKGMRGHV